MKARILTLLAAAVLLDQPAPAGEPLPRQVRPGSAAVSTGVFPPSNSVAHMISLGDTVWVGSGRGVARTLDGGTTWESYFGDPAFAAHGIYAIAASPGEFWAATGYVREVNGQDVQTGAGYAVTTDRGRSWHGLPQPLDATGDSLVTYGINTVRFLPIVVPEQNVTFDAALGAGKVWIASWSSGLRSSADHGASWQRTVLPADNRNTVSPGDSLGRYVVDPRLHNNFLVFSVSVQNDSTIWAGTAGGVNKSTDGGISWTKYTTLNQLSPILGNWVIAIGIQPRDSLTRVWITNWKADLDPAEEFGVSVTDDGGRLWRTALHGVRAYAFAFRGETAYVATDDGIYRSDDGGVSWSRSGTITDTRSRQRITTRTFYSLAVIGDTLWAGGADGIVKTVDSPTRPFASWWQVLRTYRPTAAAETYAYPNPFSPDDEYVRIHYATAAGPVQVSIEIFDFGMNRVRTVVKDAERTGPAQYDELWNGRDDANAPVANGVYFYRLSVSGRDPVWGKVMVLQ